MIYWSVMSGNDVVTFPAYTVQITVVIPSCIFWLFFTLATRFSRKGCEIVLRNSSGLFQVKRIVRRTLLFQGRNKNPVINLSQQTIRITLELSGRVSSSIFCQLADAGREGGSAGDWRVSGADVRVHLPVSDPRPADCPAVQGREGAAHHPASSSLQHPQQVQWQHREGLCQT